MPEDRKRRIPHFAYIEEFDLTELEALRKDLNDNRTAEQPKLTVLPFLMRALVKAGPEIPAGERALRRRGRHSPPLRGQFISASRRKPPGGLMVPVVRHAEAPLDLCGSARELARVTTAARNGSATREELTGSTITLTQPWRPSAASPRPRCINHPEVAIIGLEQDGSSGRSSSMARSSIRTMMNLSSSFDHRIVDGYDAASSSRA